MAVLGQKFESIADETETWYGSKYKLEKIPESTIQKWESCGFCDELRLPDKNEFITSNFEILFKDEKKVGL